jgi:uncharacterized protein YqgC (DUF456 family)
MLQDVLMSDVGEFFAWTMPWDSVIMAYVVLVILLILGLMGCVLPILPGHMLIVLAAVIHRLWLGDESCLNRWTFVALLLMWATAQWIEWASGAAGAKFFGGSKWGAWGAVLGGLVGMFFFPIGLLVGPFVGAFALEKVLAKKELRPSAVSGIGSMVGVAFGIFMQVLVGVAMVTWIVVDLWLGA